MYTILENARIVLALLKEHNIRHIVTSPGGSNIPIVQGIQQDPFFTCYSVVDERSAMYFAIGLYLKLGVPIATTCTSAQATRNYIPGLTEAFYKHVPILAITMSKHPRYLGQEYMQCPIQTSLPKDAIKQSYSLPYIANNHDRIQCIRIANEAILELTHHSLGPVQLNIEELDSETWVFDKNITNLPSIRTIKRFTFNETWNISLDNRKILLLIGEHRPFSKNEKKAIEDFCKAYNVFVYSNNIANYHGEFALNANIVAANSTQSFFEQELKPDILLTIGGLTGDYGIYFKLTNSPDGSFEHWRISPDGNVVDTYNKLTKIFEVPEEIFFQRFVTTQNSQEEEHTYFQTWKSVLSQTDLTFDIPYSNMYAAQQLYKLIPKNSTLNFAILNSLRTWSYFDLDPTISCFSNVAAFGIDGCLSTMIGQSVATENLTFLITGDLAFFYDMNALGIRHIKENVRILLVNNNGGAEFKLSNLEERTEVSSFISAANHFKNAKGWAETNGFVYISAQNKEEFSQLVCQFVDESKQPIIFEIFTTPENERKANQIINQRNIIETKKENIKTTIKQNIKNILGDKAIELIKNSIK